MGITSMEWVGLERTWNLIQFHLLLWDTPLDKLCPAWPSGAHPRLREFRAEQHTQCSGGSWRRGTDSPKCIELRACRALQRMNTNPNCTGVCLLWRPTPPEVKEATCT